MIDPFQFQRTLHPAAPWFSEASLVQALEEDRHWASIHVCADHLYHSTTWLCSARRETADATEIGIQVCDLMVEYFSDIVDLHSAHGRRPGYDRQWSS